MEFMSIIWVGFIIVCIMTVETLLSAVPLSECMSLFLNSSVTSRWDRECDLDRDHVERRLWIRQRLRDLDRLELFRSWNACRGTIPVAFQASRKRLTNVVLIVWHGSPCRLAWDFEILNVFYFPWPEKQFILAVIYEITTTSNPLKVIAIFMILLLTFFTSVWEITIRWGQLSANVVLPSWVGVDGLCTRTVSASTWDLLPDSPPPKCYSPPL